MAEEYKSINITGGAAKDYTGTAGKRTRATKKNMKGGSSSSPLLSGMENTKSIAINAAPTQVAQVAPTQVTPIIRPVLSPSLPQQPQPQQQSQSQPQQQQQSQQQGGSTPIKVELKKKHDTKKVQLHPKKIEAPKVPFVKKHQTHKVRKVSLGISSLHKRMTRAKKMHKKVKEMPLDKLKEHLVSKKLIKSTSKAPESVLRQIAADSQIVASKAL
jgi:hypothetical protein